jgi:phospholipid transport system substrate-binding protein
MTKMHRTWSSGTSVIVVLLVAYLARPVSAMASAPRERIRGIMAAAAVVFRDPELQGAERAPQRRDRVRSIIADAFDFRSMARESLGSQWGRLTPPQQEEFVQLFGDLFKASYSSLVLKFLGEREAVFGEEVVQSDRALVRTTLRDRQGDELPVDYRLVDDAGRWRVHDVIVDGVSLAGNYRGQFSRVIQTSSYEALREKIQAKAKAGE